MRDLDPAARLKGSRFLGQELDSLRAEMRAADGADPVLAGIRWDVPSLIGFYSDGQPQAYAVGVGVGADRHSQYDLWRPNPVDDPDAFRGQSFLIVGAWDPSALLASAFDSVSSREVVYRENGRALTTWYVCVCRGFRGFGPVRPGAGH
jgi:hypothetical protein